ncbi:MAG: vitamin K epoxide reductase family protein [Candidatus Woesearchaeota archaeon]
MILVLATIGFIISIYGYYVQQEKKKRICDITKNISCTSALTSKEAYLFGFSNTLLGIFGYPLLAITYQLGFLELTTLGIIIACTLSLYLAYINYFKQRNFCLVCTASYLVNFLLLTMVIFI